ncbi:MAG: hypothetical protein JSS42_08575 [Proteobacteria bacterium]|nr:hypothetical protein [Pseudomonadota bacterium]
MALVERTTDGFFEMAVCSAIERYDRSLLQRYGLRRSLAGELDFRPVTPALYRSSQVVVPCRERDIDAAEPIGQAAESRLVRRIRQRNSGIASERATGTHRDSQRVSV